MMLLETIEAGNRTRDGVRDALEDTYSFEGATGTMYFDPVGEAKKELFLLTVEGKRIVEITEGLW
jgi:ABC-type branched-subunit amino acid transport system substrate-binding protein